MQGTWKTNGDGGKGALVLAGAAIGVVVLLGSGAATAAVTALTGLLEMVLFCALAAVAVVIAAAVLIWRKYGRATAPVPEQFAAFHQAQQVRAAGKRPAIAPVQHWHVHFHGEQQPESVPAVLHAIRDREQS